MHDRFLVQLASTQASMFELHRFRNVLVQEWIDPNPMTPNLFLPLGQTGKSLLSKLLPEVVYRFKI
jgi:hypothetical protein